VELLAIGRAKSPTFERLLERAKQAAADEDSVSSQFRALKQNIVDGEVARRTRSSCAVVVKAPSRPPPLQGRWSTCPGQLRSTSITRKQGRPPCNALFETRLNVWVVVPSQGGL